MRLPVSKVLLQAFFEMLSVSKVLCGPWTKKNMLTLSGKDNIPALRYDKDGWYGMRTGWLVWGDFISQSQCFTVQGTSEGSAKFPSPSAKLFEDNYQAACY